MSEVPVLFPIDEKRGLRESVKTILSDLNEAVEEGQIQEPAWNVRRSEGRRVLRVIFGSEKDAIYGKMKAERGT